MKKTLLHFAFCIIASPLFSQHWEQVGDFNNTVRVMLDDTVSGLLYVSGNFRFNGIDTVDGFCSFDGVNFVSYGRRIDCASFGCTPSFLIARYKEELYFSGPNLTSINGISDINGIARWDGVKWAAAMHGLYYKEDDNPFLDNYYIYDGNLYGVGFFKTADGVTCNSVAYWNGQKWTGLAFPSWPDNTVPRVSIVSFFQDQLYVGGNFSWSQSGGADIARLDSTGWVMAGGGLKGGLSSAFDIKVYKGELYICGRFHKIDGNVGNGIMRWDGQQWREVGEGFCNPNITASAMLVHDGKLYVVGNFECVDNGLSASRIAVWDGEIWSNLGNSLINNNISSIASYKGEIYIGGGFTEIDGKPCRSLARWVDYEDGKPLKDGFGLWPNPVRDILQIIAPLPVESVWIIDAAGRTIIRSEVTGGVRTSVPVGDWVPGLYFVVVRAGGESWGGKFVKM